MMHSTNRRPLWPLAAITLVVSATADAVPSCLVEGRVEHRQSLSEMRDCLHNDAMEPDRFAAFCKRFGQPREPSVTIGDSRWTDVRVRPVESCPPNPLAACESFGGLAITTRYYTRTDAELAEIQGACLAAGGRWHARHGIETETAALTEADATPANVLAHYVEALKTADFARIRAYLSTSFVEVVDLHREPNRWIARNETILGSVPDRYRIETLSETGDLTQLRLHTDRLDPRSVNRYITPPRSADVRMVRERGGWKVDGVRWGSAIGRGGMPTLLGKCFRGSPNAGGPAVADDKALRGPMDAMLVSRDCGELTAVISFATPATVAPVAATPRPDPEAVVARREIRRLFALYRKALLENDPDAAYGLVDANTHRYYSALLEAARYADAEALRSAPFLDRLGVVQTRHMISPAVLMTLDGRSYFRYAVENGWFSRDSVASLRVGAVEVRGDVATAAMHNAMQKLPTPFTFRRDDGEWRIDLTAVMRQANDTMLAAARDAGMSEDSFVFWIVGTVSGRPVDPSVWNPVVSR